jgi:hypothetical protein
MRIFKTCFMTITLSSSCARRSGWRSCRNREVSSSNPCIWDRFQVFFFLLPPGKLWDDVLSKYPTITSFYTLPNSSTFLSRWRDQEPINPSVGSTCFYRFAVPNYSHVITFCVKEVQLGVYAVLDVCSRESVYMSSFRYKRRRWKNCGQRCVCVMKQRCSKVMGKRRGVFRKLVAFMCTFRHGKAYSGSRLSVSPVRDRSAIQVALACDGEDPEPETSVSIAGTSISRWVVRCAQSTGVLYEAYILNGLRCFMFRSPEHVHFSRLLYHRFPGLSTCYLINLTTVSQITD